MAIQTPKTISRLFTRHDRRIADLENDTPKQHVYEPHSNANVVATSPSGGGIVLIPLLFTNTMPLRRLTVVVDDQVAGALVRAAIYSVDTDLTVEPNPLGAATSERITFRKAVVSTSSYLTLGILNPAKVHFDFDQIFLNPHRRHWFAAIDLNTVNGNGLYGTHDPLGGATDIPSHFVLAGQSGFSEFLTASAICRPAYIMARSVVGLRLVRYS